MLQAVLEAAICFNFLPSHYFLVECLRSGVVFGNDGGDIFVATDVVFSHPVKNTLRLSISSINSSCVLPNFAEIDG